MQAELVLLMLFRPREGALLLPRRQPILTAGAVLFLAALAEGLATTLVVRATTGSGSSLFFVVWNMLLNLAAMLLTLITASIFLPFGARMVGGRGDTEDFLWTLGFSFAPWSLWAALVLVLQMSSVAAPLYFILQVLFGGWILWIQVQGLGAVFGVTVLRALFGTLLGYGLAAMLYLLFTGMGFLSVLNTLVLWTV